VVSFPPVFPPKLCTHLSFPPTRATCPAQLILYDLITRIIFGEEYSSPSVRMYQRGSHRTDLREIWYWWLPKKKFCQDIPNLVNIGKNIRHSKRLSKHVSLLPATLNCYEDSLRMKWYRNSVVFWDVTQRRLVSHRHFGTRYRSHLQGSKNVHFWMGPILSPETSVRNKSTLRNIPEDDRIQVNRSGSLRTRESYHAVRVAAGV
jgi:hypothetical protein